MNRAHLSASTAENDRAHPASNRSLKRRVATRIIERVTQPAPIIKEPVKSFAASRLVSLSASWVRDCRSRRASATYISNITFVVDKFSWWCKREKVESVDADALRGFFIYLDTAHTLPEGRWGERGETRADIEKKFGCPAETKYRQVCAGTIKDYKRVLTTFLNWIVKQGLVEVSPIESVGDTIERDNEIHFDVFTEEEAGKILAAAAKCGNRDSAMALLLLDTGIRASELADLMWADVDLDGAKGTIRSGKGGKTRRIFWSTTTNSALWRYVHERELDTEGQSQAIPVFVGRPGRYVGQQLTRSGVFQITQRWAQMAEVKHCHPHTFRHTFATLFLMEGGNQMALMELMGHSDIKQTQKYVKFTQTSMEAQAKQFSVVNRVKKVKKRQSGA